MALQRDRASGLIAPGTPSASRRGRFLQKHAGKLELTWKYEVTVQSASGMAFLSGRGFVHRDLAARNVLLDSKREAKIVGLLRATTVCFGFMCPLPSSYRFTPRKPLSRLPDLDVLD